MSINLLKSLRRFYISIKYYQAERTLISPVEGKTRLMRQKSQKIQYYVKISTKRIKPYQQGCPWDIFICPIPIP